MYIVRKYHRQIDQFIRSGSRAAFSVAFVLLLVVLAAMALVTFKFGAPANNGRPWDTPVILDGAWRIVNGQVPHRDYYNYLGDLPFFTTCLGMRLGHASAVSIDYGNLLFMAALVLPAMVVLRRRTGALPAFLFCLFVGLLVVTPKPLGDPYDYTDHAMLYNRYGEACLALFGVLLFLPPRPGFNAGWMTWLEAVFAGFLLTALLGCKLNYFAVGIGFFGVACITGRFGLGRAVACVMGAAAFLAAVLILTKIPPSEVLKDYRIMAACQSAGGRIRGMVVQGAKSILLLPVLLVLAWEGFLGEAKPNGHRLRAWRELLIITAIFGGAVMLLATDCQQGEMPQLALAALYGSEMIQRRADEPAETLFFITARHLGAFLLLLLFLLPPILDDLATVRFVTFAAVKKNWESTATLESTHLDDFRFIRGGTRSEEMREYSDRVDEGIQLLRRHPDSETLLNVLMFSDPFHVALGLMPSSGGVIGMSSDSLVKASHPSMARLLGNATHLLTDRGAGILKEAYGAEWDALHLEIVEETTNYSLFKIPEKPKNR